MMRGQATSIQSIPSEKVVRLSTTDRPSNKLPSYSSPSTCPAGEAIKVSSGLGSDVPNGFDTIQNTWKLPDLSSLHNACRTRLSHSRDKTRFSSEDITVTELTVPHPTGARHHADHSSARPERSD